MNKNLLLTIAAVAIVFFGYSIFNSNNQKVTDIDLYEDQQIAAQAVCSNPANKPKLSNITVTSITATSAVLTWTTVTNDGNQVPLLSNSNHRYGLFSGSLGAWQSVSNTNGVYTHSRPLSGLSPNTKYQYRVRSASVPYGCQTTSSTYNFTTLNTAGGVPAMVTGLTATNLQCNNLTLTWNASTNATGYEVYGPNSACNVNASAGYCGSTAGTTLPISGLAASTTYTGSTGNAGFTVLAYNASGYSAGTPRLSVTTPACSTADTVPPTVTITSPTSGTTYTTTVSTVSLAGTATDNTGVTLVSATRNGSAVTVSGTTSWTANAITLTSGTNTIIVTARDAAGNTAIDTLTVTYNAQAQDIVAPTTTFSAATGTWTNSGVSRVLTCTDPQPNPSGCASTWWKFMTMGAACDDGGYTSGSTATKAQEGRWKLCTFSLDNANNNESIGPTGVKSTEPFNIDLTPPTGAITNPTAGSAVSNTITVSASASDALSGVASVAFKLDGASLATDATGPAWTYSWNTVTATNGAHTITAVVTDLAGNTFTTPAVSFTVANAAADTTPPTTTTSAPSSSWSNTSLSRTLTCTDNGGGSGCSTTYWQFVTQGSACPAVGSGSYTTGTAASTTTEGMWRLCYYSKDVAGNTENPAKYQEAYKLDKTIPTGNITAPTAGSTVSGTTTISASASDALSGVASVTFKLDGTTTINTDTTSPYSVSWDTNGATNGSHALSIVVTDVAGNVYTSGTTTVTVNNVTTVIISNLTVTNVSTTTAVINWETNIQADTQVYYGTTTAYGSQTVLSPAPTIYHSQTISSLSPLTTYHYQARSSGAFANDMTFTTLGANYSWPGTGLDIGTGLVSNSEPSGLAWSNGNIFAISDGSVLSKITPTGTILNNWTIPGGPDTEAVAVTDVNSYVYISYENGAGGGANNPEIREFNPATGTLTGKYWILSGMTVTSNKGMEGFTWVPNGHSPYTGTSGGVFYATTENTSATIYVFNVDLSSAAGTTVSPITSFVAATDGRVLNDLWYATDSRTLYAIANGANKLKAFNISTAIPTTITDQTLPAEGVTQEGFTTEPSCPGTTTNVYIAEDTGGTGHVIHKYTNYAVTCNAGADPYIVAAGDIAISGGSQMQTSNYIINSLSAAAAVLQLGDNAYSNGTLAEFNTHYDPSWGRTAIVSKSKPIPGNHEYGTSGASGYFSYFQGKGVNVGTTGQGWYSYNVGNWHIVALNTNSECSTVSCAAGSAQETWLRNDLAANPTQCSLAYWHHPRFTSGTGHSNSTATQPLWKAFQDYGGDVVLTGHVHNYERFAPQTSSGTGTGVLDNANGIRSFVVGTGGTPNFYSPGAPIANSAFQLGSTFGVFKLTLHPTSYDWQFIRTSDGAVMDSGTGNCH